MFCGDRKWDDGILIRSFLNQLDPANDTIITGGAAGAGHLAHRAADEMGFKTIVVQAKWQEYGKAAGPIRNRAMLVLCDGKVFAFHDDLARSRGTANCVKQARAMGIQVEVVRHTGVPPGYGTLEDAAEDAAREGFTKR